MNPQPQLWMVLETGRVVPIGHQSPRQRPGDLVRDPGRNALYRCYAERGRVRWGYLGPLTRS